MVTSTLSYQEKVDKCIEILRLELPTLFKKEISYDIYSEDISFKDPVNSFKGKFFYRIIFWTLRFHAQLFFTDIHFDLHEVKQSESDIIRADWTVRGSLLVPWKTSILFDGFSLYKLNDNGLIYDHVDTWDRKPTEILKQFFGK